MITNNYEILKHALLQIEDIQAQGKRDSFVPAVQINMDRTGRIVVSIAMQVQKNYKTLVGPFIHIRQPDIAGQLADILDVLTIQGISVYPGSF